jgi:hypothetical protein
MPELDLPSPKQVPSWIWIAGIGGVFILVLLNRGKQSQGTAPSENLLASEFDARFREFQEQLIEWMRYSINPPKGVIPVTPPSPVDHGWNICQGDPNCEQGYITPPPVRGLMPVFPPGGADNIGASQPYDGSSLKPPPNPPMPPYNPPPGSKIPYWGGAYTQMTERGEGLRNYRTSADILQ